MKKILEKKINVNQRHCFVCGGPVGISYELTNVDGPEGWSDVSFYAPILDCSKCDDQIFAPEYHQIENEAMCLAAGVLTPDEIKSIRKNIPWGNNNVIFSKILGFGSSTIARYESGASIPSKAHNKILKFLKYPNIVRDFEQSEEYKKYFKSKKSENTGFVNSKEASQRLDELPNSFEETSDKKKIVGKKNNAKNNYNYDNVIKLFDRVSSLPSDQIEKINKNANKQNIIFRRA